MSHAPRRQKGGYFPAIEGAPPPIVVRLNHRIRFSDVDPMGILWHGRYTKLFEQANEEIGRISGMSYPEFQRDKLIAPIVQLHIDYFAPVKLAENVTIVGRMVWSEGARMDMEYEIRRENGSLGATGYTVQMFVDEGGVPLMAAPAMQETCRRRWRAGEFGTAR
jgi:acyl-CoA thioester hydrolase